MTTGKGQGSCGRGLAGADCCGRGVDPDDLARPGLVHGFAAAGARAPGLRGGALRSTGFFPADPV